MNEPTGQTSSGSPRAVSSNPKTQAGMGDGTGGLPSGATSTHFDAESSVRGSSSGSDQSPGVINPYVTADSNSIPATTNVSADRVKQIDPGPQTLGDC